MTINDAFKKYLSPEKQAENKQNKDIMCLPGPYRLRSFCVTGNALGLDEQSPIIDVKVIRVKWKNLARSINKLSAFDKDSNEEMDIAVLVAGGYESYKKCLKLCEVINRLKKIDGELDIFVGTENTLKSNFGLYVDVLSICDGKKYDARTKTIEENFADNITDFFY